MKIWVYLTLATIVTTTAVTWADVNFNIFEYNPQAAFHKKPKIDYVAEILKIDIQVPRAADILAKQRQQKIHLASVITSDAEQPASIRGPVVPRRLATIKPESCPLPWNRVVIDALAAETGWHGAIRIRECDRAVEERFSGDLPTVVECQVKDGNTVYYTITVRRDEDYRSRSHRWQAR